ncbi:MAG: DUF3990 domain-containing protein [Clostridia bacterium]|nr:DUF3990 domain-containing protein [Clostridia bacterium]
MILFHGSYTEVAKPDLLHSRPNVDFGRGFYTTSIYEQAEKWCGRFRKKGRKGIISVYRLDEAAFGQLDVLRFESYNEEWLDFILNCRSGCDTSGYDIVYGGVANDKVFNTVELYLDQLIDKAEALKRLRYEKPNMQLALRTEAALTYLQFERSIGL